MISTTRKFFQFGPEVYRKKFYKALFLNVLTGVFKAFRIPAIAILLDGIIRNEVSYHVILKSFAVLFVGFIGEWLLRGKSTMLQTEAGYGTATDKRIEIAEHMRYLPMGYFNSNSLGQITSVTTNIMENLQNVATRVVMLVSEGLFTTSLIAIAILIYDWRIGLILVLGCVLFFSVNAMMQRVSISFSHKKADTDTALVESVIEFLHGMVEVKSFGLTSEKSEKLDRAIKENVKANTAIEYALIPFMTIQNVIIKITGVIMSLASIIFYLDNTMSLLDCIVMIIASFLVYASLETAGNYSALMRMVEVCIERAEEILSVKGMKTDGDDYTPSTHNIDIKDISFSYERKKIIDGISVSIPERTTTAIVGPSGGGKTTFCNLVSRFWDVDAGTILLDGKDVRSYSMDALMKNFSFVFQNVYLFKDTIANNIRFGAPDSPMEKVIEAAKQARCHDFIMALKDGYETVIGEGGANLSGGEKQRISIARAIMKDSPIIVLDEATANIDPENERELIEAIEALTRKKTILMIAHRLKTVQHADKILVIDKGKIRQSGDHETLMKEEGIYKRFVLSRESAISWSI
ncbi:MAG: ABC transporter ATP-binding protein [Spirochaetales bacterium]|nr:ABC transporter ATP-binding protein [Spirochaetales bacterium]